MIRHPLTSLVLTGLLLVQAQAFAQDNRSLILPRQAPAADAGADRITILDSLYGQDERHCRALEKLASRCNGHHSCLIESGDDLCGDPYRNVGKQLFVAYRCGDESARRTLTLAEGDSASIYCRQAPVPAASQQGLIIREAVYGRGARHCDAQARLSSECDGQSRCSVRVDNSLCGDPAKGDQKDIRIRYDCLGKEKTMTVSERSTAVLTCP